MEIEIQRHFETHGEFPSDEELRKAGLAIVHTADSIVEASQNPAASWLRDIFKPRASKDNGTSRQPHGQPDACAKASKGFFGECDLELQLRRYARMHICLGQDVADDKLQAEACRILRHVEGSSLYSSRYLLGFLTRLIWSSNAWLAPLRARATQDLVSIAGTGIALDGARSTRTSVVGTRPQSQGEAINQTLLGSTNPTAVDFHSPRPQSPWTSALHDDMLCATTDSGIYPPATATNSGPSLFAATNPGASNNSEDIGGNIRFRMPSDHFISSGYSVPGDAPCQRTVTSWSGNAYQRLARGLSLYVMKAMSPLNPQFHVPTDDELRYQGRWLLYDE